MNNIPPWLGQTVQQLMKVAEGLFGPGTGKAKKRWVRSALMDAAQSVDLPKIPGWAESPAKEAIVDMAIEVLWSANFQRKRKAA